MCVGLVLGTLCDNQHFQRVMRAGARPLVQSFCAGSWIALAAVVLHMLCDKQRFQRTGARPGVEKVNPVRTFRGDGKPI